MTRGINENAIHINRCLRLIETQLGWGGSDTWTQYDFSKLSDEVHNRTQVRLSVTTLKRIWGRLKYDSAPTVTTLNTLAQFAGYSDWRDFCTKDDGKESPSVKPAHTVMPAQKRKGKRYWFALVIPVVIGMFYVVPSDEEARHDHTAFQFEANKIVTEGVPNSVVFHYDASAAKTDSVFIVQTWDIRRKKLVSRNNHEHSAIYYYPGYFRTRLIADGEAVKSHDLWITSDGWLCLIQDDPVPIYFSKDEYLFDDRVEVTGEVLKNYNVSLHPEAPLLRFFNQRDFGDIANDNFTFETTLKNDFKDGSGKCQFVEVLIQCKDDIVIIPLAAKECVGDLELYFCGTHVKAEDADLSKFGRDLSEWTTLRVESVNRNVDIFVNNEKAYSLDFPHEPTGVVGVQYRFYGVGAVKDTWFEWKGTRVVL